MKMEDYADEIRQAFLTGEMTNEMKLQRAKAQLGTRYLLHPANHVRIAQRPADARSRTTDVLRTARSYARRTCLDLV